ncbi:hypothetical protein [Reichenbachiella ulvae]|uniref:Uncharacterized protein n=1 Tax=Reichenbachiella ulvae TaxID=2980104 RepID=A0ABT3CX53_9BACT|nr:hypothetical protein [Reichenbachiella ulvae]MCV9388281.1 hypothetical protein [Reichenbachiella ulvae]
MKPPILSLLILIFFTACDSKDDVIEMIEEELPNQTFSFSDYNWSSFNASVFDVKLDGEELTLTLNQNAAWFNAETGGMYFMTHSGDFDFSATVVTSNVAGTQAPVESYSFGGLVARDPGSASENYVHVVTGTGVNTQSPISGYEYKITRDSQSDYTITQDGSHAHDLRLVREGNLFSFYQRTAESEENWNLIHSTEQNMPTELQLGFTIYTAFDGPETLDMQVHISHVKLQSE